MDTSMLMEMAHSKHATQQQKMQQSVNNSKLFGEAIS